MDMVNNTTTVKTKYVDTGSEYQVVRVDDANMLDKLPPGISIIRHDFENQLFLKKLPNDYLSVPTVLFGTQVNEQSQKVINKFLNTDKNVGALFTGDQGSGKSITVNTICQKMLALGYPVIISDIDNMVIVTNIIQNCANCVILFDEFSKNYKNEYQEKLLSLLDGSSNTKESKKLFLFTENDTNNINRYLLHRPSRIFYHFKYNKLNTEVVTLYVENSLISPKYKDDILKHYSECVSFSFDDLQAIVSECNRAVEGVSFSDIIEHLNCSKPSEKNIKFIIEKVFMNDSKLTPIPEFHYIQDNTTSDTANPILVCQSPSINRIFCSFQLSLTPYKKDKNSKADSVNLQSPFSNSNRSEYTNDCVNTGYSNSILKYDIDKKQMLVLSRNGNYVFLLQLVD